MGWVIFTDMSSNGRYSSTNWERFSLRKKKRNWKQEKIAKKARMSRKVKGLTYALRLCNSETPAEIALKTALKIAHIQYQFQAPIFGKDNKFRIVDFLIQQPHHAPLIVEVDGDYHNSEEQIWLDAKREQWLVKQTGHEIIRFSNDDVLNNPESVIGRIASKIRSI